MRVQDQASHDDIDAALASRLCSLRKSRGMTLDDLSHASGISRASLSRFERCEISPTAAALGRLAGVYGVTVGDLFSVATADCGALLRRERQLVWTDAQTGFRRKAVSPVQHGFKVSISEGVIPAGVAIDFPVPPILHLEHHIYVLDGVLELDVGTRSYRVEAGDCLRFRLMGKSCYRAPGPEEARYLVLVAVA